MKYVKIKNGYISENAIISTIANSISKIAGVSERRAEMVNEFIFAISGHDIKKGIKINIENDEISDLSIYIDCEIGINVEYVINNLIEQITNDLKVFLILDASQINIHVLEVK